jgi:16S rRNA processing protein RimM
VDAAERPVPIATQERGSGGQGRTPEPRFLAIGQVVGVHGVRGELKVEILTEDPHRFDLLRQVLVGLEDQEPVPWILESYRLHKGHALLKLQGCDDRTAAETLRGYLIQVRFEDALPLEEGEYFEHQIIGLQVWTAAGEPLGEVAEILYTGANDVYVVRGGSPGGRDILIPAIEDVVLEIDLDGGRLVVELPEGLR